MVAVAASVAATPCLAVDPRSEVALLPAPPVEPDLHVAPPGEATGVRTRDLARFMARDTALRARAQRADALRGAGLVSAGAAALSLVALPFLLRRDVEDVADGGGRPRSRAGAALLVSLGSGGLALGLLAASNSEARRVADAWNAAHPEQPLVMWH